MRVLPSGDRAFLLEFDDVQAVISKHAAIRLAKIPGIVELVPAARTILIQIDPQLRRLEDVITQVTALDPVTPETDEARVVEISIRYDGPDLAEVAGLMGLTEEDLVRAHSGQLWLAAFTGFTPGFAYLVGQRQQFDVPRRRDPRVSVPKGAVALGGPFTGIYPRESPGGWQIIGSTDAELWNLAWEIPALIEPGALVRFVQQ